MKRRAPYILITVLIISQIYSLAKMNSLQGKLENINNALYTVENRLGGQINSIYHDVDEKLKVEASLINDFTTVVGEFNAETHTVPITFTVEPKSVTESMSVLLDINGEMIELEKSGMQYATTRYFEVLDDISIKIIIDDNGVKNIEEQAGLNSMQIQERLFPRLFASFVGESTYGSDEYRANGRLYIDYKPSKENNRFVDMKYVIEVDDQVIKETPIECDGDKGLDLIIDDEVPLDTGQTLVSNVVAVDSYGYVHEYLTIHYVAGSGEQRESSLDQMRITAPDGYIVYLFDEKTAKTEANH